ncbi:MULTISPECIES: mechanosensitive ion channel family protein [Paenibacillus]|uniref:Mechanosensitive ion channel family protein n=1 Tax=Paenibacillus radicis (ex Xue et al. 2023) TaxID=2972489 RepID=A0ABT1YUY9_9BACL|nr:mechanosensitive ion channel family protein [Paenibacillus radicis (ex Xue et al. 2023)]MCR8636763.1 mechanosensitive ion channel family protein [Paenibacillus radicis (ex Xue et al. 2023)]
MNYLVQGFLLEDKMGLIAGWQQVWDPFIAYISNPEVWTGLLIGALKVIFIYFAGRLVMKLANKALEHMLVARDRNPLKLDTRRTNTIGRLLGNITAYVVNFIVILMILNQFGIRLEPILAGAGVVGLAIGFGAQSLVKDVITGFFIIFEDQFAVGDIVQIGTYKGTVEEIGLRVTKLKSWTGEVHFIPNGTINQVTNFSLNNSIAVVDISIAYASDIDKALEVLRTTVLKNYESNVNMVKEPQVLGVQTLSTSEITLRTTVECKPNTQALVSRELYAEIKKALDALSIESKESQAN